MTESKETSVDTSIVQDIEILTKKLAEMISTLKELEDRLLTANITTKSLTFRDVLYLKTIDLSWTKIAILFGKSRMSLS